MTTYFIHHICILFKIARFLKFTKYHLEFGQELDFIWDVLELWIRYTGEFLEEKKRFCPFKISSTVPYSFFGREKAANNAVLFIGLDQCNSCVCESNWNSDSHVFIFFLDSKLLESIFYSDVWSLVHKNAPNTVVIYSMVSNYRGVLNKTWRYYIGRFGYYIKNHFLFSK